jgi:hypothetical protein
MAGRKYQSAEGRDHPSAYSADQLMGYLVEDAVKHHATDLRWFVAAILEVARQRNIDAEAAMLALLDEVEALTGMRALPIHSGQL